MATRLPIAMSKLSNKESKLRYRFKARSNKGVQSEEDTVELHFHTPVSKKYCCVLCRNLLRDPCQVTCCQSSYCKDCIDSLSTTSGKCANKNCGKNYSIITGGFAVEDLGRKIRQLRVHCLLKSSGCRWVGTIEKLEQSHLVSAHYDKRDNAACQYQDVECPNMCGVTVPRGRMAEHQLSDCEREMTVCEYCGREDSSYAIFKVHQRMCLSMPVECPNKCGIPGIARSAILSHLETECPLRLALCKYRHVGCEERVRVTSLEEHNTSSYQKHLDLMSEKLEFVINENTELRGENGQLHEEITMLLSKLRDLKFSVGSVDDIMDYYIMMNPVHGGREYPSPFHSSGSMDTLTHSGSTLSSSSGSINTLIVQEDDESGYNSVINEVPPNSENVPLSSPRGSGYINVRANSRSVSDSVYEVVPDLWADVSRSAGRSESKVSFPGRSYSTQSGVDDGPYMNVKRKAFRSTSLPERGEARLVGSQSLQFGGEVDLPSIDEDADRRKLPLNNESCTESTVSELVNGSNDELCLDSESSVTGDHNKGTVNAAATKKTKDGPYVTFHSHVEVISDLRADPTPVGEGEMSAEVNEEDALWFNNDDVFALQTEPVTPSEGSNGITNVSEASVARCGVINKMDEAPSVMNMSEMDGADVTNEASEGFCGGMKISEMDSAEKTPSQGRRGVVKMNKMDAADATPLESRVGVTNASNTSEDGVTNRSKVDNANRTLSEGRHCAANVIKLASAGKLHIDNVRSCSTAYTISFRPRSRVISNSDHSRQAVNCRRPLATRRRTPPPPPIPDVASTMSLAGPATPTPLPIVPPVVGRESVLPLTEPHRIRSNVLPIGSLPPHTQPIPVEPPTIGSSVLPIGSLPSHTQPIPVEPPTIGSSVLSTGSLPPHTQPIPVEPPTIGSSVLPTGSLPAHTQPIPVEPPTIGSGVLPTGSLPPHTQPIPVEPPTIGGGVLPTGSLPPHTQPIPVEPPTIGSSILPQRGATPVESPTIRSSVQPLPPQRGPTPVEPPTIRSSVQPLPPQRGPTPVEPPTIRSSVRPLPPQRGPTPVEPPTVGSSVQPLPPQRGPTPVEPPTIRSSVQPLPPQRGPTPVEPPTIRSSVRPLPPQRGPTPVEPPTVGSSVHPLPPQRGPTPVEPPTVRSSVQPVRGPTPVESFSSGLRRGSLPTRTKLVAVKPPTVEAISSSAGHGPLPSPRPTPRRTRLNPAKDKSKSETSLPKTGFKYSDSAISCKKPAPPQPAPRPDRSSLGTSRLPVRVLPHRSFSTLSLPSHDTEHWEELKRALEKRSSDVW